MFVKLTILLISLSSLLITSCTTYSKKECQNLDWNRIGFKEALKGHTKDQGLKYYRKECGQNHGVQPEIKLFTDGFTKGLKAFCTAHKARQFGTTGGTYKGTCNKKSEDKFIKNYTLGFNQYLKTKVDELSVENANLKSRLGDLESENSSLKSEISDMQFNSNN